jgi:RNA polymerase sigma factor (sigma-70 family)
VTGDGDEAEDATQDACIKAYYALASFDSSAPFRPWLLRIAANEARNRRRSSQRRANTARRAAADASSPDPEKLDPEIAFLARERREALHSALDGLRGVDRDVVDSRYFAALSEAEMAERLGVARGTVKSRLSRALSRLRMALAAAALAVLVVLAAVLVASREARDAIADRLGLRGVDITHLPAPTVPTVQPAGQFTLPAALAGANLGVLVSLDEARARNEERLYQPTLTEIGPLRAVYVLDDGRARVTTQIYSPPVGALASASGTVLLAQITGTLEPAVVGKGLGPESRLSPVTVDGGRGFWIDGRPHFVVFRDRSGEFREDTLRLAGNTLLWEHGADAVLRLEGVATLELALRIAGSVRP